MFFQNKFQLIEQKNQDNNLNNIGCYRQISNMCSDKFWDDYNKKILSDILLKTELW